MDEFLRERLKLFSVFVLFWLIIIVVAHRVDAYNLTMTEEFNANLQTRIDAYDDMVKGALRRPVIASLVCMTLALFGFSFRYVIANKLVTSGLVQRDDARYWVDRTVLWFMVLSNMFLVATLFITFEVTKG